jgi:DNA-binding MarR family transcriptional regulator/GNAT superfamily N-acetyltransferase
MTTAVDPAHAERLREFNRFYTSRIGVLREGLLDSAFSLTQARVLYELAQREPVAARDISGALELDAGYLSRILQGFAKRGLIARKLSARDRRSQNLRLTDPGRAAFSALDRASHETSIALLSAMSAFDRARLLRALDTAQRALSPPAPDAQRVSIRQHRSGDIGWAISLHGRVYGEEYGWNAEFEALVATLFAQFASRGDSAGERCWIAEIDGERVGCVFVVRNDHDAEVAQLRCLLVDPDARGFGIGQRLIDTCLAFARDAGYRRMRLWTNDVLTSARRLYETSGFALVEEAPHRSFGHDLVGQVWERDLA